MVKILLLFPKRTAKHFQINAEWLLLCCPLSSPITCIAGGRAVSEGWAGAKGRAKGELLGFGVTSGVACSLWSTLCHGMCGMDVGDWAAPWPCVLQPGRNAVSSLTPLPRTHAPEHHVQPCKGTLRHLPEWQMFTAFRYRHLISLNSVLFAWG